MLQGLTNLALKIPEIWNVNFPSVLFFGERDFPRKHD